jgi:predicted permease
VIDDYHRGLGPIGFLDHGPTIVVPTSDGAEGIQTVAATANYFQILGIRPSHGRIFDTRDAEQPGRSAMLSYDTWQRWFGGDERIVGHTVRLGSAQFDIVGILPRDFLFPSWLAGAPEIVTAMDPVRRGVEGGTVHSIVRLERAITREQAQAEIEALTAPIAARRSEPNTTLVLDDVRSVLYPEGRTIMPLLLVTAGLVLLIGCANLANMLLVRTRQREHEAGVRAALGASRTRLVGPLIFESLLTSLTGAVLAVSVTSMTFDTLIQQVPRVAYRHAPVGVDIRVLLFALALGLLSGLLFSAIPSWRAARLDAQALIRQRYFRQHTRSKFLGRPLVAVQVALAIVLVFGATVSAAGFARVLSVPLGFDPENVLTVRVSPPEVEERDKLAFYARAIETLANRADVTSVGATYLLPPSNSRGYEPAWTPESKDSGVESGIVPVLPGYFETAGIRLVRGRLPDWSDFQSRTSMAVVSESAARVLFPARDPVGAVIETRLGQQFTVVGVVADVGNLRPGEQPQPYSYVIPDSDPPGLTLVARVRSRRGEMLADIRREISSLAPKTIVNVSWWQDSIDARTEFRNPRFQTLVLGSFATLSLVLASLGILALWPSWLLLGPTKWV